MRFRIIALGALLLASGNLYGQLSSELSYQQARRLGLEAAWSRAISIGQGGKISGVTIHVSPTRSYRGSEVKDKYGRRIFFSDRDPTRTVSRAGYDQTARLTELKMAELTARNLDPQSSETEIAEVTVYVRSTMGTVTAVDAETGKIKWSAQAGTPGYPSYSVSATDDQVVTLSSSSMYLMDATSGQILESSPLQNIPGGTPTLDGNWIYLPTIKGLVEVYSTDDLRRPQFTLGSSGRIETTVTVSPSTVSWSTDAGYIYVANAGAPGIIYRFQSLDTIAAAPVYADETLFATSLDGFVYAIEERNGDVKWRHSAGGPIREAPLVVDGVVYVTTIDGQMSALDAVTGQSKWSVENVDRFVSVSESNVYCMAAGNRLTVLDKASGKRVGSEHVGRLGLPVINTKTDRVYLVSQSGVLHCLREPANRWPLTRLPPVPAETEEAEESTEQAGVEPADQAAPTAQEETEASVPAADEDPFGGFEADETPQQGDVGDEPFNDPFEDGGFDDGSADGSADGSSDPFDDPF